MTGNKLRNLDLLLKNLMLPTLQIDRNQIQYLTDKDFLTTKDVFILELQENEIARIDTNTFNSFRDQLLSLDLSSNLLTSLNGSIRYLFKLEVLKLERNSLQVRQFSLNMHIKKNPPVLSLSVHVISNLNMKILFKLAILRLLRKEILSSLTDWKTLECLTESYFDENA